MPAALLATDPMVKGTSAAGLSCTPLCPVQGSRQICCSWLSPRGNCAVASFGPRVTNFAGEMEELVWVCICLVLTGEGLCAGHLWQPYAQASSFIPC